MKARLHWLPVLIFGTCCYLAPELAHASVESSLSAIQDKLINVILPLVGILGLCFAAFSFFIGNPNARTHLMLAMFGAAIGFGSPAIIAFIRGMVN